LTTPQRDLARIAQDAIDANSYLTPATADRTGLLWPSPVWYADAGYRESFRVSAPGTRQSRNLAERPEAGSSSLTPTCPPDPWLGVGDDTLILARPASLHASDTGIEFAADDLEVDTAHTESLACARIIAARAG
jgi:hypothetical protein